MLFADFLAGRKKSPIFLKKRLDKTPVAWYTIGAKKQSVSRSHPAANERAWLIDFPFKKGILSREAMLGAIFYFAGSIPGNGGNFLLAQQEIY